MNRYRIYCDEGVKGQYAGILRQMTTGAWKVCFREGVQYYFPGFEGSFEACRAYLHRCFSGRLVRCHGDNPLSLVKKNVYQG